ncbi:PREDICTED: butyrophilin subfamily 1 member A1-like [Ceratotherium simum simum]|uniref:Butyrophilin subfamily 1 member A1-like n=1 Tax=Ceratotherium simum simum TaxID=73337 RepID=A0ABM1CFS6_CERSS|nr:PREDICTED: butyrophilin subfamily 1 member A1-like [Ceratotherium simum simum]XP_014638407.1 PREDICTED: butyrophilin subfamily 1 member A1-like [Ceratotherium simum simum]
MEDCSSRSVLCHLTSLLLLIQLPLAGSAEEFFMIGPLDPIVAMLGGDATLPCRVCPTMSVENMELRWFRSKFSEVVFIYQNQREHNEEQMAQYAGRTSLVRDLLTQGEAAVHIHKVQASDDGLYTCFFRKGGFYEEASLELKVAGVGSVPQVHIKGPEEEGVRVVCMASRWFPKPQVQWRDLSGKKFLAFSETHAKDEEGLFSVEASLVVRDSSAGNVTCSILNPILGQEKTMAIFIPEPFFPQASLWKPAFIVILTVLTLLLLGAVYYTKREHSTKLQELQKQKGLRQAKEEDQQAKEEALKARDELQADLDWRQSVYLAAWRKAQMYADWWKEKFQAWSVTLDPGSAHPNLSLSPEKTSLTWKDTHVDSGDTCSILGLEGITSGRCYWEVEVRNRDRSKWALGVCRGDVKRKGWYRESPDKGFWVVGQFGKNYCACTIPDTSLSLRQFPHRVGVFLDYNEGDVSFYNMSDGSHIFSFPQASFSGTLFPYFMLKSGKMSLTICPTVGGSEGFPVPINNSPSSLEEPVSLPGEEFSSGSGVDGAPPAVESPLLPCNSEAASL